MGENLIEYALEKIQDLKPELGTLFKEHYLINCPMPDKLEMKPDWQRWYQLSELDILKVFTARKNNKLVGYVFIFVSQSLHYMDHYYAYVDGIYVRKQNRASGTGYYLLKYAEDYVANMGASVIGINTRVDAPFDKLLERLGYSLQERSYAKWIGK